MNIKFINVGVVKTILLNKLNESLLNEKSLNDLKENITEFCNIINNSPILQSEYKLFENLENKFIDNDIIATRYIDNNIKLFESFNINDINSEHDKLLKFVDENDINNFNNNLNESIITLILESKINENTSPNIDLLHESFLTVLNHIKTNKNNTNSLNENTANKELLNNNIIELAIHKFNEKYDSQLDEDDKTLLKILTKSNKEEKKSLFDTYKKDAITILEKIDNEQIKDEINESIKKINIMEYNVKNINEDIITLFELNKSLKTLLE